MGRTLFPFLSAVVLTSLGVSAAGREVDQRKTRKHPLDGLTYVWVEPGEFTMGCARDCEPSEMPAHQVHITRGFWMAETELPVGAFKRFVDATHASMPEEPNFRGRALNPRWADDRLPMIDVTWDQARGYCGWAGGRLPTAAEWEYAARAGTTGAAYDDPELIAWNSDNSGPTLDSAKALQERAGGDGRRMLDVLKENGNTVHPVGTKAPNAFGLHDMIGNVLEWVADFQPASYPRPMNTETDPTGVAAGARRATRGGSWITAPAHLRVTAQTSGALDYKSNYLGFRCIQS